MESKYKKLSFWRQKARFLFRILLAIGFIVQSLKFLEMYLDYPSTVELEVVQPSEVELPAITVCNINEIRSTPYCKEYPEYCGTPDEDPDFCVHFAEYCNLVNTTKKVPLFSDKAFFRHLSRHEQQVLGHQYHNLVRTCTIETDDEETNCSAMKFREDCTVESLIIKILHPSEIHLVLNLEVSEYHPSHLSRGGQLAIHSPYHVPSPVSEGLFLNMGTVYRVYVRLAEKNLLPPPYKSMCKNYTKLWREDGGKGPVTEKMCKEKCKLEKSLYLYGCVERRIDYPHNQTICRTQSSTFQGKPVWSVRKAVHRLAKCENMNLKYRKLIVKVADQSAFLVSLAVTWVCGWASRCCTCTISWRHASSGSSAPPRGNAAAGRGRYVSFPKVGRSLLPSVIPCRQSQPTKTSSPTVNLLQQSKLSTGHNSKQTQLSCHDVIGIQNHKQEQIVY
ncbi:uncharacterized protein TNCT_267271 [Trichonephila clavata]|uniref:Amiloride-sensitive sodium channel n=1 Tax=Trichonephila clavata TaxID=2740835 RepID=A0A8X6LZQ6_TRICU|nr:uncharacterized protein TNCT_267271 [Trichonephila clavata]